MHRRTYHIVRISLVCRTAFFAALLALLSGQSSVAQNQRQAVKRDNHNGLGTFLVLAAVTTYGASSYYAAQGDYGPLALGLIPATTAVVGELAKRSDARRRNAAMFLDDNDEILAIDMARGQGDHLASLANLLDCSESGRLLLASYTKAVWGELFPDSADEGPNLSVRFAANVPRTKELAQACPELEDFVLGAFPQIVSH